MKPCLKSILILFAAVFAFAEFQMEDASAQGPIIRRMREKLNKGKPLLPFVADMESDKDKPEESGKKPTPAKAKKEPTPAKKPSGAAKKKDKFPSIKLDSRPPRDSKTAGRAGVSKEFGIAIKKAGESIVVSQIDSRGNAADAGVKRGDVILAAGGAKLQDIEEFDAIADAMSGGDRVEFEISRRGSKPEKVLIQFGQPEERDEEKEAAKFEALPSLDPAPASVPTKRSFSDRYEPSVGSGLKSVYEETEKPSSILTPTPAPNRVESLDELDFPALDGGK